MILSKNYVRQLAINSGFTGRHIDAIVNIAICESDLNTDAHCKNCLGVPEDSKGLLQVNINAHPEFKNVDLFNPQINMNAGFQIYKENGYTFKAWRNCANQFGYLNNFPNTDEKKSDFMALALVGLFFLYSTK